MITRANLKELVLQAAKSAGLAVSSETEEKISVDYPESKFGDFATNAALMLSKAAKLNPHDIAQKIIDNIEADYFNKIEMAGPGFINFYLKDDFLVAQIQSLAEQGVLKHQERPGKILLEYFQPNIAKPLHLGHLENAIIGDTIRRQMEHLGYVVESDTHMGDWGTQFGVLIWAYKHYGDEKEVAKDPITKLNEYYIKANQEIEKDKTLLEQCKQEFVSLEKGDEVNAKIWKKFVDWSMEKFLTINELADILPFDHHWPESFYQDKMPKVLDKLKAAGILKESQGAQIVDLEEEKLGVAIMIKSDGGTTYLLRDLATFIYRRGLGFKKQIYVVDNRQSHSFRQLFAILTKLGEIQHGEATHVDYGFMGFKGQALSTRKGNMILALDVLSEAQTKVDKIITEKNPDLPNKQKAIRAVALSAVKYFILSHNRHSDIDFDWDQALDFDGDSGPYLQYVYARLSSILRKEAFSGTLGTNEEMTETERQVVMELTRFNDKVEDSVKDFLPNIFANYMFELAGLINKFYHESPVLKEPNEVKKQFRLGLIAAAQKTFAKGLYLLGITPLEEM